MTVKDPPDDADLDLLLEEQRELFDRRVRRSFRLEQHYLWIVRTGLILAGVVVSAASILRVQEVYSESILPLVPVTFGGGAMLLSTLAAVILYVNFDIFAGVVPERDAFEEDGTRIRMSDDEARFTQDRVVKAYLRGNEALRISNQRDGERMVVLMSLLFGGLLLFIIGVVLSVTVA